MTNRTETSPKSTSTADYLQKEYQGLLAQLHAVAQSMKIARDAGFADSDMMRYVDQAIALGVDADGAFDQLTDALCAD